MQHDVFSWATPLLLLLALVAVQATTSWHLLAVDRRDLRWRIDGWLQVDGDQATMWKCWKEVRDRCGRSRWGFWCVEPWRQSASEYSARPISVAKRRDWRRRRRRPTRRREELTIVRSYKWDAAKWRNRKSCCCTRRNDGDAATTTCPTTNTSREQATAKRVSCKHHKQSRTSAS
jgi:hypothetical protein